MPSIIQPHTAAQTAYIKYNKKFNFSDIHLFIDGWQRFEAILSKIVEIIPQVTKDDNNLFLILPNYTMDIICIVHKGYCPGQWDPPLAGAGRTI